MLYKDCFYSITWINYNFRVINASVGRDGDIEHLEQNNWQDSSLAKYLDRERDGSNFREVTKESYIWIRRHLKNELFLISCLHIRQCWQNLRLFVYFQWKLQNISGKNNIVYTNAVRKKKWVLRGGRIHRPLKYCLLVIPGWPDENEFMG